MTDVVDKQERAREKEIPLTVCLHMSRAQDEWLTTYGTDLGRDEWLASNAYYYKNRKSLVGAYRRLKKRALEHHAIFGFKCDKGLSDFHATREIIGPPFRERYTDAYCAVQGVCKEYRSVDQALIDLAKHPKGQA